MEWTPEAIDHLRSLWGEGHSTAEIGRRMGISKNAVVGKAHRLDLPARPSPIRREGVDAGSAAGGTAALPRRAPAPQAQRAPAPALPPPPPRRMPPAPPPAATAASPAPAAAPCPPQPVPPRPAVATAAAVRPVAAGGSVVRPFPRTSVRNCAWPMGEPGTAEFRFCGCDALPGKPYCADHAAVAYVKVRDRREDAA